MTRLTPTGQATRVEGARRRVERQPGPEVAQMIRDGAITDAKSLAAYAVLVVSEA
jgi:hypothetical protein